MTRMPRFLVVAAACAAVAACSPQREPDLSTIASNIQKTHAGDFGDLAFNLYQAEKKADIAQTSHDKIKAAPPYLFTDLPLRQQAVKLSAEAVEHRMKAEAALNRFLDPIRARIAALEARVDYLESIHVPKGTSLIKESIFFDTGKWNIRASEQPKLANIAQRLKEYPVATIVVEGFTDTVGSAASNRQLSRLRADSVATALRRIGVPSSTTVSTIGQGEAAGPDQTENQQNRRVDILFAPHGRFPGMMAK